MRKKLARTAPTSIKLLIVKTLKQKWRHHLIVTASINLFAKQIDAYSIQDNSNNSSKVIPWDL